MSPLDAVEDCKISWCKILLLDLTAETSLNKIPLLLPCFSYRHWHFISELCLRSQFRKCDLLFHPWDYRGQYDLCENMVCNVLCAQCSESCVKWIMAIFFKNNFLFAKHMTVNWLHLLFLLLHKLSLERICYYNNLTLIQTLILRSLPSKERKMAFQALSSRT